MTPSLNKPSKQYECPLCGVKFDYFDGDENHYCPREYRLGDNTVTIWVGNQYGSPKRTWHVHLNWPWIFRSPRERLVDKRIRAQKYADKLNHRESYLYHDLSISKRSEL